MSTTHHFFQQPFAESEREGLRLNLEGLRSQLTRRLAILVIGISQLMILFYESPALFPVNIFVFWALLTGLGGVTLWWSGNGRDIVARHFLVWGLTLELLLAMWLFTTPWLPFLGLLLVFSHAMMVRGSEFVAGLLIAGLSIRLANSGVRTYDLSGILVGLTLSIVTAVLTIRTLYTALDWLWNLHRRAEELLRTVRDQQVELKNLVKSLEMTNDLQRRTQRELMIAHKEAQKARQQKEQFAANISHELRTPLSIILGFSEVMYLSPEVYGDDIWSPKLYGDVSQIYRNSRHLLTMIDDILDLSHFEMSGFTLHKEMVAFSQIVQDAVDMAANLFHASPVMLVSDIAPDLPFLEIDRTRIRQVILNLLNNARRFTQVGCVKVVAKGIGDEVVVQVQDTGIGIPSEQLPHIFDEFFQVDYSLSRRHGGAGLGLAICQRFVQAHHGRIWVDSQAGVGSTFSFALPLPEKAVYPSKLYRTRLVEPPPLKTLPKLLVIDSDVAVVSMIQRYLDGYDAIQVSKEDELVKAIRQHQPTAVLWNIVPGKTIQKEHIDNLSIPVITCSLPSRTWMAQQLGAVACFHKPLDFKQLQWQIKQLGDIQHILVIDDNIGMCQLVERVLSTLSKRCEITVTYDGRNGLASMRRQRPDLILLDLIMPEMDGFELLDVMKSDPHLAQIPVILLTATSYTEDHLLQNGNCMTIYQPNTLRPMEILTCLKAFVDTLLHD